MTVFYFLHDPGHGWLKVPLRLVADLGIASDISQFSYRDSQYAYLEEDCDMRRFCDAMEKAGYGKVETQDVYVESETDRRNPRTKQRFK